MTRVQWGAAGERLFEGGIDRGMLYVDGEIGVPWNGLVSVNETVSGGEAKVFYQDNVPYLGLISPEAYTATIGAFYTPPEFDACDGVQSLTNGFLVKQQRRKQFGFAYRTRVGNDIDGTKHGYKIHLVYNALATPSEHAYETQSNEVSLSPLTWEIFAKPVVIPGSRPSAHFVIDTTRLYSWVVPVLENILYGDDDDDPRLPDPTEILDVIATNAHFEISLYPGGVFNISAPDSAVLKNENGEWELAWDAAEYVSSDEFTIDAPIANLGEKFTIAKNAYPDPSHWYGWGAFSNVPGVPTAGAGVLMLDTTEKHSGKQSIKFKNTTPRVVSVTNPVQNPDGVNANYWSTAGTGTYSIQTGPTQGYAQCTWTAPSTTLTGGLTYSVSATDPNLTIAPGEHASVSAEVWCSRDQNMYIYRQYLDASGATLGSSQAAFSAKANTWVVAKYNSSSVAPAGAVRVRILIYSNSTNGTLWQAGDILRARYVTMNKAATAIDPFSGNKPADSGYGGSKYQFSGTPNASSSQLTLPGRGTGLYKSGSSIGTPASFGYSVGDIVTFAVWMKVPTGVDVYGSSNGTGFGMLGTALAASSYGTNPTIRDEWVRMSTTFTIVDANGSLSPRMYGPENSDDEIWYDDFMVTKGTADELPNDFNGDTNSGIYDVIWLGTPGASASEMSWTVS